MMRIKYQADLSRGPCRQRPRRSRNGYLKRFPNGSFAGLARIRVKKLRPPAPETIVPMDQRPVMRQHSNWIPQWGLFKFDPVRDKPFFIRAAPWEASLCRSILAKDETNTTLGHIHLAKHLIDTIPTLSGA